MGAVVAVLYGAALLASVVASIIGHNQRMQEREREAQKDEEARKQVCTKSRPSVIVANAKISESLTKLKGNISTMRVASILR